MLRNLFITLLVLAAGTTSVFAQRVFTERQMEKIACAKERLYAVYNFLDASKPSSDKTYTPAACGANSKAVPMPRYLDKILPEMDSKRLWQVEGECGVSLSALLSIFLN